MRGLIRPILLITLILAIPVVPFAVLGPSFESRLESQVRAAASPPAVGLLVVGLLAVDVFLPVPSSVVSTVAGSTLGIAWGTGASWLGMTLGALLAFVLARGLGRPLALRFSGEESWARIDALSSHYGPLVLVLARPVPILAEASVLFFGATRLSWPRFFLPVALSNLGIALVYSALGDLVQLPIALAASIALPLVLTVVARWVWPAGGVESGEVESGEWGVGSRVPSGNGRGGDVD